MIEGVGRVPFRLLAVLLFAAGCGGNVQQHVAEAESPEVNPEEFYPGFLQGLATIRVDGLRASGHAGRLRAIFESHLSGTLRGSSDEATGQELFDSVQELRLAIALDAPSSSERPGVSGGPAEVFVGLVRTTISFERLKAVFRLQEAEIDGRRALLSEMGGSVELGDGWWLIAPQDALPRLLRDGRPRSLDRPGWARLASERLANATVEYLIVPYPRAPDRNNVLGDFEAAIASFELTEGASFSGLILSRSEGDVAEVQALASGITGALGAHYQRACAAERGGEATEVSTDSNPLPFLEMIPLDGLSSDVAESIEGTRFARHQREFRVHGEVSPELVSRLLDMLALLSRGAN